MEIKGEFDIFTLALSKDTGWLSLHDDNASVTLAQEDIQTLLPYLQAFAETGQLEPTQEPTLQGEEDRINAIAKASAKRVLEIIETQKKRIDELEKENAYCMRRLASSDMDQIETVESELATMQEAGVAMAANIVDQGSRIEALVETTARMNFKNYEQEKRIQALEKLLLKWKEFGWTDDVKSSDTWSDLDTQTIQLLHEG